MSREVRLHQAAARAAVWSDIDKAKMKSLGPLRWLATKAGTREAHLMAPALGSFLAPESAASLKPEPSQVQILLSDGLSAEALNANAPEILTFLQAGLKAQGVSVGTPLITEYGRVKLAEDISKRLKAPLVLYLIGERPGGDANAAKSLSCYFVYQLLDAIHQKKAAAYGGQPGVQFEYSVLSNIYAEGIPPAEAAAVIVERAKKMLELGAAGNRFESLLSGNNRT